MNERLIGANALAKLFSDAFRHNGCKDMTYSEYMNVIRNAPTIDPETLGYRKVVQGRWEQHSDFDEDANVYECSECGEPWVLNAGTPQENYMNYCPKCGAIMDAEGGEE